MLKSLAELDLHQLTTRLFIADNDPAGSARDVVDAHADSLPMGVHYVIEPNRGLASVRNRLVKEAKDSGSEYIAFADDDETVDTAWLQALHGQIVTSDADAGMGLQIRWFDSDIPRSIQNCFPAPKRTSGQQIRLFSTANVLIRMSSLEGIEGPFDMRLNLTGGEDSMLSARIRANGGKIVWCQEAVSREYVPRSRTGYRYILQRSFRAGTTRSKIARWVNPSWETTVKHLLEGCGVVAKHAVLAVPDAVVNRDNLLFRFRCIVGGFGAIAGTLTPRAYSRLEYETIHGS